MSGITQALIGGLGNRKSVEFITSVSSTSDASSYTFNNTSVGSAIGGRYIVLGVTGSSGSAGGISSITINGSSSTELVQVSGSTTVSGLYIILLESGTTANIVVNFSVSKARCAVGVWKITGINSTTPYDTATASATTDINVLSTNIDTLSGGIVIASVTRGGLVGGTTTWTGVTEDYDFILEDRIFSGGSLLETATTSAKLIKTNFSNSNTAGALSVVSF